MREACAASDRSALGYAEYARGYEPLCEEIAKYVSRSRAVSCSAEQIIVVNGSQQGLDLCARLLLEPGDEVAVENPGYSGASRVFEATGARLRPFRSTRRVSSAPAWVRPPKWCM